MKNIYRELGLNTKYSDLLCKACKKNTFVDWDVVCTNCGKVYSDEKYWWCLDCIPDKCDECGELFGEFEWSYPSQCVKDEAEDKYRCGCENCLKKELKERGFIKGGKIRRLA